MSAKKLLSAVIGLAAAATTGVLTAAPSSAAYPVDGGGPTARNGVCEVGEFCLYYNSNQSGSMVDLGGSDANYGSDPANCTKFITGTAAGGRGLCVKNNAASAWNRRGVIVTVFYKSGYAGAIDTIPASTAENLVKTKNQNAGHLVGDATNSNMSYSLYEAGGGYISSYFDGYLYTSGRHEGIDLAKGIGEPVHSLTAGTVTSKVEGYEGSGGLSTIAIYNAALDKTVIYLHSNPLNGLGVGDSVARGQQIATESWRGVGSSGSAHTHVEMRPGRQTSASKSVGDETLSNPNPTDFWMNRGYNIGR